MSKKDLQELHGTYNYENKLFSTPPASNSKGHLAILLRDLLAKTGLDLKLEAMIELYIRNDIIKQKLRKGRESVEATVRKRGLNKSGLRNKFTATEMTLKNFEFLLMEILEVKELRFTVEVDFKGSKYGVPDGTYTTNVLKITGETYEEEDDETTDSPEKSKEG